MTAKELFDGGDLGAAIAQMGKEVGESPLDYRKRTFLFELLCCSGELDRAAKQLDMIAEESADRSIATQSYKNLLAGERKRRLLFSEGRVPGLPKRIPQYTHLHLEAVNRMREGRYQEARDLLEQAENVRPPVRGTINGEVFEDLKDANDLIGPFLEIIVNDNYSWVPWEAIESVTIAAPQHVRDLVWAPAHIELDIGPLGDVSIPVLYADSYLHQDNRVKLGRMTDWRDDVDGLALATGQKLLAAGDRDWPFLEVRQLEIESASLGDGDHGDSGSSD